MTREELIEWHRGQSVPWAPEPGAYYNATVEMLRTDGEELSRLRADNQHLRAALANSSDACAYCQLPRDEMIKCRAGFPGCSRADDMMGCPELGAALEADQLRARVAELEAAQRMRPMSEAPRDGTRILVRTHEDGWHVVRFDAGTTLNQWLDLFSVVWIDERFFAGWWPLPERQK